MRTGITIALWAIITIACAGGCKTANKSHLTVRGGEPITYRCENGEQIVARYYSLSDASLNFVKIVMPDGKKYTLPQIVSASGARYTADRDLVWWTKGDTAFVQTRNQNGDWQTKYNCKEIREK